MAGPLLHHDLVQPPLRVEGDALERLDRERHALLDPGPPVQDRADQGDRTGWFDLGEEPKPADHHAQHRTPEVGRGVGTSQERAVTSDRHDQVQTLPTAIRTLPDPVVVQDSRSSRRRCSAPP